jgi:hypothetical protein
MKTRQSHNTRREGALFYAFVCISRIKRLQNENSIEREREREEQEQEEEFFLRFV